MITAPDFLEDIINADIEVTIRKDFDDGCIGFDLNSQAKSHMFLFDGPDTGEWKIRGRYNFEEVVEDLDDVMWIFKRFYDMREFGNGDWLSLLEKHGIVERVETVSVTYQ